MSEIMRPMPFETLMSWALEEYKQQGRIFGVQKEKFYKNNSGTGFEIFGEKISSPVGPAAGPNSQLAQNILASYLAGSRFVELKTVQIMDGEELRACVPRPCINAEDEGYNVEWSTELTVPQAFEEYVKAWVAIHVFAKELGISEEKDFVFNMSVGYNLDGIKTEKIDNYIEGMKNAAETEVWQSSLNWLSENIGKFSAFTKSDITKISPAVSNSVTLSTLHGCPPDEIERIAKYLLNEKKVNTFVKCNPTLLGYKFTRGILDEMGYSYISFDEHHFNDDLQYSDAVTMLEGLIAYSSERNLAFGVKITNTFPVQIKRGELPGEEMYMSGRSLFPLSISVASKLAQSFNGKLPISYSGGADLFNIENILATGIRPITVATTILKPGGYERISQLATLLEPKLSSLSASIDVNMLKSFADNVPSMAYYRKEHRPAQSLKTDIPLTLFDCYQAPCKDGGCPIQQQIPEYLSLVAQGKYDEAFSIIAVDNAAPSITGTLCPHPCQQKCTRVDYDSSLEIRSAKLTASNSSQEKYNATVKPANIKTNKKAVVVGAGPAGIAAALYLRRNGVSVTVLEKRDRPFGIVEYVIPGFRISAEAIQRDFQTAVNAGVDFKFGVKEIVNAAELKKEYDFVLIATGAWKEGVAAVKDGAENLRDALDFLLESKAKDCNIDLGKSVAVIGGGDVAMDCARAAKRAAGVEKVTVVYRRTREFMPAEPEEICLALEDNVEFMELLAPLKYNNNLLTCEKMQLGNWDASGRRGIVGTGEIVDLAFDSVIGAVGARVDNTIFETSGLSLNKWGSPQVSAANESSLPGIYVIGDCRKGPATIVAAMGDAKLASIDILIKCGLNHDFARHSVPQDIAILYNKKGVLIEAANNNTDGYRCLACDQLCEICCDVCPNRANVRIELPGFENKHQILHVDSQCNECGNCGIFCPHAGNPYKDKFTIFWTQEDFVDSENTGFLKMQDGRYNIRLEDKTILNNVDLKHAGVPESFRLFIQTIENNYSYYLA